MRPIIAIDPGLSGGVAWTYCNGDGCFAAVAMPKTEGDIVSLINSIIVNTPNYTVFMEEVGGYCGAAMPGGAMFNFGRNFGFILGVLAARGVRVELVRPQKWQKHFSLGTVNESGGRTPWKNKLKQKAQQLFPHLDITLKTADALLILEYGKKQNT